MKQSSELSHLKIFKFWAPLSATWLMMSVEGPFLAAIIARMIEPKFNLAAYGVAFSIALIVEAPVIMIMSASTALVKNKISFLKLRNFTFLINTIITLVMLIILIEPVFNFIAKELLNLDAKVMGLTYKAIWLLLPWPGAIGFRRFYQGILIRYNSTKLVAMGTVIRLTTMTATALILHSSGKFHGVEVGAAALSAGVVFESIASKLMSLKAVRNLPVDETCKLNYKEISIFYYPLALMSMLSLGVHPLVTLFMGYSRFPLESLAVLPVLNSLVFIFRSFGLSYQETIIALYGENGENAQKLKQFAILMGAFVFVGLSIIALTPLNFIWFHTVSGLSLELSNFVHVPLLILIILPTLTVVISYQRSVLVAARKTQPITFATSFEVIGIIITLFIMVNYLNAVGIIAAATAYVFGRILANIYLIKPTREA